MPDETVPTEQPPPVEAAPAEAAPAPAPAEPLPSVMIDPQLADVITKSEDQPSAPSPPTEEKRG